jgi:membrane protein DedA with SNARE-associated domain
MLMFCTLAAGTLLSEDLTCILAGVLIQQGQLNASAGIAACATGIYLGDLGLYVIGRLLGARVLAWSHVRRYLTPGRKQRFAEWFASNAAAAILASRFLPGTRLPLYLACGALRASFGQFARWSLAAVALWAPVVVLASARSSDAASDPLIGALVLLVVMRLVLRAMTRRGREQLAAAVSRVWRWEFWPMWLFYAPVGAWIAWLSIRHRGVTAIAAANPGMPDGGIVGESKHEILAQLPPEHTIPSVLIRTATREARIRQLLSHVTSHGWAFPLVFKPDVGQRGAGVKVVRTLEEAGEYLARERGPVLVQPYHPGPFEAGVFYYRMPGWSRGRILSITDKHFPVVVGDGRSTLEELIWANARLRMQARTFLERHSSRRDEILGASQSLPLAIAGNHAQGTLFRDGRHLITRALEDRIDRIAWGYQGFFIGRFDIRYTDVGRFKAGEDLAIVELNGATAESTNIYDPAGSLFDAYRQLFRQWALVFAIGAANRRNGAAASSWRRLTDLIRVHLASDVAYPTSD